MIKNDYVEELESSQFACQNSEICRVKMKNLKAFDTSAFRTCIINEFDAPKVHRVHEMYIMDADGRVYIRKKNF